MLSPCIRALRRASGDSAGIGLMDLLFALLITAVGALTVYTLITAGAGARQQAADEMVAANAARQEIEILRSMDAYLLSNRTNGSLIGAVTQLSNLTGGAGTLTIADYGSIDNIKKVTVTITWTTRTSTRTRSLSMSTLIGEGGVGV